MQKQTCVFLTSRYPFGKTESFIENEIDFLSKSFNKIVVLSLDSGRGECRFVPSNVIVCPMKVWGNFFVKAIRFFYGFFANIKNCRFEGNGFIDKVQFWYDRGTTYLIYKKIKKFQNLYYNDLQNTIFYSYWLDNNAAAISLFRTKMDIGHKAIYISRAHGSDLYSERTKTNYLSMQRFAVNTLDWIFPISNHGLFYLNKKYSSVNSHFKTFYLGTRDNGLSPAYNDDYFTLLTCSNIIPLKRLVTFAEVFCNFARIKKNVKWICIGSGSDEEIIKNVISMNKCDMFFEFKGRLSNNEVIEFYKKNKIDFFVNVSRYEGLPVSIMEAFSFGVPVIATNVGAVCEIVNENNGFLINCQSTSAIFSVLNSAYNLSEEDKIKMRFVARNTWKMLFDSNKNYISFYDFIKNGIY